MDVYLYRAVVVQKAIGLYLKSGMKVNRAYTPQAMRDVVSEYTGKTYARSRKGLEEAYKDLSALLATE